MRATKISVHCKNVNMAEPYGYIRDARSKFSMGRKLEWKLNVSAANKKRRIEISEKKESIVNVNENYGSFTIRERIGR